MCGYLFILEKKSFVNKQKALAALKLQENRGPDYSNHKILKINEKNFFESIDEGSSIGQIFLGHNRLKIIDLSEKSNQPILSDKNFLLYNGEFYNYKKFSSPVTANSDTLTLFSELKKNNYEIVKEINGMWSFIFANLERQEIIFSRDRYGKKPLYYYESKDLFIASTDTRSIFHYLGTNTRNIDLENFVRMYTLKLNSYSSDTTFYKNIKQVKPGFNLFLNINNFEKKFLKYKNFDNFSKKKIFNNPINSFRSDFDNALKLRTISDRNIGFLVSGGVDSSMIISSYFKNLKNLDNSFFYFARTINKTTGKENLEDKFFAELLAKKLKFKLNIIDIDESEESIEKNVKDMILYFDQPLNFELTAVPISFICKQMKKDNVPVLIDGAGGDEIMGGYPTFFSLALANCRTRNIKDAIKFYINHLTFDKNFSFKNLLIFFREFFMKNPILEKKFKHLNFLKNDFKNLAIKSINFQRDNYTKISKRQIFEIFNYQIPFYLQVNDSFSMKHSIENRSPFLDKNLLKYIFIPDKLKYNYNFNKVLLRQSIYDNIPTEIINRKSKMGLNNSFNIKALKTDKNIDLIMSSQIVSEIMNKQFDKNILIKDDVIFKFLFNLSVLSEKNKLAL